MSVMDHWGLGGPRQGTQGGSPTWILSPFVPLDEADDEEHEDEESDGTHETDEPALRGDVYLPAGHG